MKTFLIFGAHGFLGTHLLEELRSYADVHVFAPTYGELDIRDKNAVLQAAKSVDVLINLVGIISGTRGQFRALHVQGTANVIAAAKAQHARKIIYVSALGVEHAHARRIPYFETKAQAERLVLQSGIAHTILRPSAMFGRGAGFLKPLASLIRWSPLVPLPDYGKHRIQTVAVATTARILAQAATQEDTEGTFVVSGPEVLTFAEIAKRLARFLHKRRVFLPLPFAVPIPGIVTRDQLAMMRMENIGDHSRTKEVFSYEDIYFDPDGSYPLI